jgi:hypothetical protein
MNTTQNTDVGSSTPSTQPAYPTSKEFDALAAAQEEIQATGGLLQAAAVAIRSGRFSEVKDTARCLVDVAQKSLERALDHLVEHNSEEIRYFDAEIYQLIGMLFVVKSTLDADEEVSGEKLVDHPVAHALEMAAEAAGEKDYEHGLNGEMDSVLRNLYGGRHAFEADPGGVHTRGGNAGLTFRTLH